ncbi:MAG: hypothetical protein EOP86_18555 [Verrucomicrobiaceae bacterium]|nr:MAG: hypothetical protein EOP86_18555 [Verrucomicrobiaceae bacterium]
MKFFPILPALLLLSGGASLAQEAIQAYGKKFFHRDGQRTETQKMGNSLVVVQETYSKDDILTEVRVFNVDEQGRPLTGRLLDGRRNKRGTMSYHYDPNSQQLMWEELKNRDGKLIRRLFYPGALKDPRYAKRIVAFSYDPQKGESAPPMEIKGSAQPIMPVTQDNGDFQPGIAQGTAAPTPQEAADAAKARNMPVTTPQTAKKASWLRQRK